MIIDISQNGGGNSTVGNILIDYFSNKSYITYSNNFRVTQDYKDNAKALGYYDEYLNNYTNDTLITYKGSKHKPTKNFNRYNGKVYILVGEKTFSSAMMFATIVLDNKLASIIGESPINSHPNHFGEIISYQTPNTKLNFVVSVKEWIRPSGKRKNNKLEVEIKLNPEEKTYKDIIKMVKK